MKSLSITATLFLAVLTMNVATVRNLQAQTYPGAPVNLIVTMDPGSGADTAGRALAEEMGKIMKTPVIVLNKPGAGSTLGADFVVKSKKDGHTLLYATASAVVHTKVTNPAIVPFDPAKDLEPLGFHCFLPLALVVQQDSPWNTLKDFVDHGKKNPGALRISVASLGNIDHMNVEIIQSMTGAQFNVIPFKAANAAITGLLGGHVEGSLVSIPLAGPHVKAGKLKMLIVSNKHAEFPDVPTAADLGFKENLLFSWFAVYGPAGLSEEVKRVLVPAIEKAVRNPDLKPKLEKLGFGVEYRSPEELRRLQSSDYAVAHSLAVKMGLHK